MIYFLVPRQPDRVGLALFTLELEIRVRSWECVRSGSEVSVVGAAPRHGDVTRFRALSNRGCCSFILSGKSTSEGYMFFSIKLHYQNNYLSFLNK